MPLMQNATDNAMRQLRFTLPQMQSASPQVNKAGSEALSTQISPANDMMAGASQGIKTMISKAQEKPDVSLADDPSQTPTPVTQQTSYNNPSVNVGLTQDGPSGEHENTVNSGVPAIQREKRLLDTTTAPDQYMPTYKKAMEKANSATDAFASFDPASVPVTKKRKFGAMLGGIAGAMSGGVGGAMNNYDAIKHAPAYEQQGRLKLGMDAANQELGRVKDYAVEGGNTIQTGINRFTAQTSADQETRLVDQFNAEGPVREADIELKKAQAGSYKNPLPSWQLRPGTVDGKRIIGFFDPKSKKVVDGKGNDITETFEDKENKPSDAERYATVYAKVKNKTATPDEILEYEGLKENKTVAGSNTFNLNNPQATAEELGWMTQQIKEYPTLKMLEALTKGNKQQQNQLRLALASEGIDVKDLTSTTQQLGETAKALMPKIDDVIKQLETPKFAAKFGPWQGRFNDFMKNQWGSADADFASIQETIDFVTTGLMRAHVGARGGEGLLKHFEQGLATGKMDAKTLVADLKSAQKFIKGYKDMVYGEENHTQDDDNTVSDAELSAYATEHKITKAAAKAEFEKEGIKVK